MRAYCLFFKQKTAYECRISDWSSDVCSSDLTGVQPHAAPGVDQDGVVAAITVEVARGDRAVGPAGVAQHTRRPAAAIDRRHQGDGGPRSEERREGKEGVRTCRCGGSPETKKKK